jgi:hypothetical protein
MTGQPAQVNGDRIVSKQRAAGTGQEGQVNWDRTTMDEIQDRQPGQDRRTVKTVQDRLDTSARTCLPERLVWQFNLNRKNGTAQPRLVSLDNGQDRRGQDNQSRNTLFNFFKLRYYGQINISYTDICYKTQPLYLSTVQRGWALAKLREEGSIFLHYYRTNDAVFSTRSDNACLWDLKGQSHQILHYFLLNSSLNLYFLCSRLWFFKFKFCLVWLKRRSTLSLHLYEHIYWLNWFYR